MVLSNRLGRRLTVCLAAGVLSVAFLAGGCQKPQWDDPKYMVKQLKEGTATRRRMALNKFDQLPEDKIRLVVPGLVKVYMDGGVNQEEAMEKLVQHPSSKAQKAYLKEIRENNAGKAGAAADALGQTKTREAVPQMLKIFKKTNDPDIMLGIVKGFVHMPDATMVDPLVNALELDVDNYPIAIHSYSCDVLGEIAQKSPGALDEKAKRALVRAQYLSNVKGQNLSKPCGLAIQKLGQPAVPILVETFKGKNEQVNALMRKYNKPDKYQFPENRAKVKAIQRLVTLRAEEAIDLFIEDLKEEKKAPKQLTGNHAVSWRKFEGQAIDEMILGLGDLQAEKARPLLEDILRGEYDTDEWDELTDWSVSLQLRQDAAFSLVRLGGSKSNDALFDMAMEGVITDLERRARYLEAKKKYDPMPITKRYQFNWMVARAYASVIDGDKMGKYEKLIEQTSGDKYKELRKKLESFKPMVKTAQECGGKGNPKAVAECYGGKLGSDDKNVRKKAAWELATMDAEAAGPVLVDHLDMEYLDSREIVELGVYNHPTKAGIEKITTILKEEKGKTGQAYELDHYRLELLRAWLRNQFD